jgi:hypothetical protein
MQTTIAKKSYQFSKMVCYPLARKRQKDFKRLEHFQEYGCWYDYEKKLSGGFEYTCCGNVL